MQTPYACPWNHRLIAMGVAGACAAPLVVAACVTPSAMGFDTHRQIGLPGCSWPAVFGMPCITCGMTTSFAYGVRGQLFTSVWVQPAGFLLMCVAAMGVVVGVWTSVSGRPVFRFLQPMLRPRLAWIACGVLAFGWMWKTSLFRGWIS